MKAADWDDAFQKEEKRDTEPHGWIQWKGTDVCIDIHCECGCLSHYDGFSMYMLRCPDCKRVYYANGHIQFIEMEKYDETLIKDAHE